MSFIRVNTTGFQPIVVIGLSGANLANTSQAITLPYVQDLTITNSTGVHTFTTFSDTDVRKLSTPGDNSIATNIVVDNATFNGSNPSSGTTAPELGIAQLSTNKDLIDFKVYMSGSNTGAHYYSGSGFITSLALKASPTAPIWVTPLTIAVDGSYTTGTVA